MLLWSPGAEDNPLHPGDDAKAQDVSRENCRGRRSDGTADADLAELIAAARRVATP